MQSERFSSADLLTLCKGGLAPRAHQDVSSCYSLGQDLLIRGRLGILQQWKRPSSNRKPWITVRQVYGRLLSRFGEMSARDDSTKGSITLLQLAPQLASLWSSIAGTLLMLPTDFFATHRVRSDRVGTCTTTQSVAFHDDWSGPQMRLSSFRARGSTLGDPLRLPRPPAGFAAPSLFAVGCRHLSLLIV